MRIHIHILPVSWTAVAEIQTIIKDLHHEPQADRPRLTGAVKYSPRIINSIAFQMFHDTPKKDRSTSSP